MQSLRVCASLHTCSVALVACKESFSVWMRQLCAAVIGVLTSAATSPGAIGLASINISLGALQLKKAEKLPGSAESPRPTLQGLLLHLAELAPCHLAHCQLSDLDSAEASVILYADVLCWCTGVIPSPDSSTDSSALRIGAWRPEVNAMGQEAISKVAGELWECSIPACPQDVIFGSPAFRMA